VAPTKDQDTEATAVPGPGGAAARRPSERVRSAAEAAKARARMGPEAAAKVPQLLDAARRGDIDALSALLAGPEPPPLDVQDPVTLRTALMEAADAGHEPVVEWLLGRGARFTLKDSAGCTALMLGAGRGAVEVVRLLLAARGQRINGRDYSGWTALMHAAAFQHRAVVEALLAGGAKRDTETSVGETAEDLTTCPAIKGLLRVSPPPPPPQSDEHALTHLHPLPQCLQSTPALPPQPPPVQVGSSRF
jgi:hypothetical protein